MNFFSNDRNTFRRWLGSLPLGVTAILMIAASPCAAAILQMTAFAPDPSPGAYNNTTIITSYSTSAGTVSDLSHAVNGWGRFDSQGSVPQVANTWGSAGVEIDGPESVLNLDVSTGVINGGDFSDTIGMEVLRDGTRVPVNDPDHDTGGPMLYLFSQEITAGVAGDGNDFFLFENGGNDFITVYPIDAAGNQIGDFALTIGTTGWGVFPGVYSRVGNGLTPGTSGLGGVAFDMEDFVGTGTLTSMRGIGIQGAVGQGQGDGVDLLVVGVNSKLAPVPEPSILVLGAIGCVLLYTNLWRHRK